MLPEDTVLGRLEIVEVYLEYDGPQLFSCRNEKNRIYLVVHAPSTDDDDNWLYVYVSSRRLGDVTTGVVSLHNAFAQPEAGAVFVVSFSREKLVKIVSALPEDVSSDWIPEDGEYLESRDSISDLTLQDVEVDDVTATGAAISLPDLPEFLRSPVPMWEFNAQTLEYLQSVRTPAAVAAARVHRPIFDITLRKGSFRTDLPVSTLSQFLLAMQGLVESLTFADTQLSRKGRRIAKQAARLDAVALFPGSFGMRIETHDGSLFANPDLTAGLQKLVDLFTVSHDLALFRSALLNIGREPALRFRSFAKAVAKSEADFAIEIALPGEAVSSQTSLSNYQVNALISALDTAITQTDKQLAFRGRLVGVVLKTKLFVLDGDVRSITGRISEDFLPSMIGKEIGSLYDATLSATLDINETTGEVNEKFKLLSLETFNPE